MTQDAGSGQPSSNNDKPRGPDKGDDRSIANRPIDPNSLPSRVNIPPGVTPEDVRDPGRQTPDAPPVDNRS